MKEDIVNLWLPLILPWIPVLIWLRPRIRLLTFKKDNGAFGYQLLAALAISAPTIVAQAYLATATGRLTVLKSPQEYLKEAPTKYYQLAHPYVDKNAVGVHYSLSTSGKYNQDLNLRMFLSMPLYAAASDTAETPSLWLAKRYSKTISNRLSEAEKKVHYSAFAEQVQREFDSTDFTRFQFLERLGNTDDHDQMKKAVQKSPVQAQGEPVVLVAHEEPFAERNGGKLGWVFKSFAIGSVVWLLLLLIPPLKPNKVGKYESGAVTSKLDWKETFDLLLPKSGYVATPLIIDLNILIYIIMVVAGLGLISFEGEDLLSWGANFRPYTAHGQWWRLLTSVFLHGGLMHVIANMVGLLFVGLFLEPKLGAKRYALLYMATGILASATSIWWHPATVSVGASGAIFGLYGGFLVLLLLGTFPKEVSKPFLVSTLVFIGYNLLMGFAGGIDNAAHVGGLVSGAVLGLVIAPWMKRSTTEERANEPTGFVRGLVHRKKEEKEVE